MKKPIFIIMLVAALVCLLWGTPKVYGQRGTVAARWFIPTIVNRYPNHGLSVGDEQKIIDTINKFYRDNNFPVRLVSVKSPHTVSANDGGTSKWGGDDGTAGGTRGDGDLTDRNGPNNDEGDNAQNWGDKEVKNLSNHRGIKISFVRTPIVGSTTPGWSVHCRSTIFVSLPKAKKIADDRKRSISATQAAAETANHEIGHVMTLEGGHKILDINDDCDCNDPCEVGADESGHAPERDNDPCGSGNFMAPSDYRTGTHMSEWQKREMLSSILKHGKCAYQWKRYYPAIKLEQMFGTGLDEVKDVITDIIVDPPDIVVETSDATDLNPIIPIPITSLDVFDLYQIYLIGIDESTKTQEDTNNIHAQVRIAAVMPEDEEINAQYSLGFDIDDDLTTGINHGGRNGIDRIVYVKAQGNIGQGTFGVMGEVYDTVSQIFQPLPEAPIALNKYRFPDSDAPADPWDTVFDFEIPKVLLNLSAVYVPVIVTAGDGIGVYDTTEFVFDTQRWLHDPTLTTFGTGVPTPCQPYPFEVSGLKPDSPFTLYLDDNPVLTGMLNDVGGFSGEFGFPSDLSTSEAHALTVQDSTGEFAYSITCPKPQEYLPGDINKDGCVDFLDMAELAKDWMRCTDANQEECFPSDNLDYPIWVTVGKPDCWCCSAQACGDSNCDEYVGEFELLSIIPLLGAEYPDPMYKPCFDYDHDLVISAADLSIVQLNYGTSPDCQVQDFIAKSRFWFQSNDQAKTIDLEPDMGSVDPSSTFVGCVSYILDLNLKSVLTVEVNPTSDAGGDWSGLANPQTIGPGENISVEICIRGENVNVGALTGSEQQVQLAEAVISSVPVP